MPYIYYEDIISVLSVVILIMEIREKFKKNFRNSLSILLVLGVVVGAIMIVGHGAKSQDSKENKENEEAEEIKETAQKVRTQEAKDSKSIVRTIEYPALISAQRENNVVAKSSGTAVVVSFELGERVATGQTLVVIDELGLQAKTDDNGFNDNQVEQAQLAIDQAEVSLKAAKKKLKALEDIKGTPKTQLDAARAEKKIAEIQLKNARLSLESIKDSRTATATSAGVIVKKEVSQGETVSAGQTLAVIADPEDIKIQFFVDESSISSIKEGMLVMLKDSSGQVLEGTVSAISPQADEQTRRFLVELKLKKQPEKPLYLGAIVSVSLDVSEKPSNSNAFILPLSAITIGQNESYVFIVDEDRAKKVVVTVDKVKGESAEILGSINETDEIIIEGNKMIQDGSPIAR